ncbi:Arc family DNA-binding protein [Edwardsiella tarda]
MKIRDIAPYGIRMPADLKEKLQAIAKKNGRSLNSEIVRILEEYVEPPKVDDMRSLSESELSSPEKMHEWMRELSEKIKTIEKVVDKHLSKND